MASTKNKTEYCESIRSHYAQVWARHPNTVRFERGPVWDVGPHFRVLKFAPDERRSMWTYATQCMSLPEDQERVELHMFSRVPSEEVVEVLVSIAHYHRTAAKLNAGDTVNFGKSWIGHSRCQHGLISLPYLDGPELEWLPRKEGRVRFLWLIPITLDELRFKQQNGLEALEQRFEKSHFDYADPHRDSVFSREWRGQKS